LSHASIEVEPGPVNVRHAYTDAYSSGSSFIAQGSAKWCAKAATIIAMNSVAEAKRPSRPMRSKNEHPTSAKMINMALTSVPTFSGSGKL